MNLAFLHTADVHVKTFDTLLDKAGYTDTVSHTVRADLLERARIDGPLSVADDVTGVLTGIVEATEVDLIVCTCSTIGELAEKSDIAVTVWRVDRPLMETAVSMGKRILMAYTVESTLKPSRDLLDAILLNHHDGAQVIECFCDEAWPYFERGDLDGYAQSIADALSNAPKADVIVLAQASMAGAIPLCHNIGVPILDSPTTAVAAIMSLVNPPIQPS